MPKQKHANVDPHLLMVFQRMASSVDGVEVKGDANPYVSMNGNMYASISKTGEIGVRLPKDARAQFIKAHNTTLYESIPGFFQREYVTVPSRLHADKTFMAQLFAQSHAYARTLKPKPTKRKAKG